MKKTIIISIVLVLVLITAFLTYFKFISVKPLSNQTAPITDSIFPTINSIKESVGNILGLGDEKISLAPADIKTIESGSIREINRLPSPGFIVNSEATSTLIYFNLENGLIESLETFGRGLVANPIYKSPLTDVYNLTGNVNNSIATLLVESSDLTGNQNKKIIRANLKDDLAIKQQTIKTASSIVVGEEGEFYTIEELGLKSVVYVYTNPLFSRQKVVNLPINDWALQVVNKGLLAVTTLPDAETRGYLYLINLLDKNVDTGFTPQTNLQTKISPDGLNILYSTGNKTENNLFVSDKENKTIVPTAVNTFAEKCVWSSNSKIVYCAVPKMELKGSHLQDWHRGDISFNDKFVAVDSTTGLAKELIDPEILGTKIDAMNLVYIESLGAVVFTNKTDLHTYLLEIN